MHVHVRVCVRACVCVCVCVCKISIVPVTTLQKAFSTFVESFAEVSMKDRLFLSKREKEKGGRRAVGYTSKKNGGEE